VKILSRAPDGKMGQRRRQLPSYELRLLGC
jgi:hypothetical protein